MGVAAGCCGPLDVPQVGAAHHAYAAGGPGLGGNPVQGVVPILHLVVVGDPLPAAFVAAPHVLDDHGIAPLHIAIVDFTALLFPIGGARQYRRDLSLHIGGQVHVGGQGHPIPHGHVKGTGVGYGTELLLRPGLSPQTQEGALLATLPHQQAHHLPGGAVHGNEFPALYLFVAGEFHIPLEIVDAVLAGVTLSRHLEFPLAAKGLGILPSVFRQSEKIHFQKGLIFPGNLWRNGLPIPQRTGKYVQPADAGSGRVQLQLAI